jgi:hypothetical protein
MADQNVIEVGRPRAAIPNAQSIDRQTCKICNGRKRDHAGEDHIFEAVSLKPLTCTQCGSAQGVVYMDGATCSARCVKCRFPKLFIRLTGG